MPLQKKNGWITPEGVYLPTRKSHDSFATQFLLKEFDDAELEDTLISQGLDYPYELLHKRGWVRTSVHFGNLTIRGACIELFEVLRNTSNPSMNPAQLRTAKELCAEHSITLSNAINHIM